MLSTSKYNYDTPPLVHWNQVELKIALQDVAGHFGITGDVEIDNGNSFAYSIMLFFPTKFNEQVVQS